MSASKDERACAEVARVSHPHLDWSYRHLLSRGDGGRVMSMDENEWCASGAHWWPGVRVYLYGYCTQGTRYS